MNNVIEQMIEKYEIKNTNDEINVYQEVISLKKLAFMVI